MNDSFWYLSGRSDQLVDAIDNTVDMSTIADGSTSYGNIATPSTTDRGVPTPSATTDTDTLPLDDGHAAATGLLNPLASSVALHHPAVMPLSTEPTVLLAEMQKAAEDVSQLVGRFGFKMAGTLRRPHIKAALFADRNRLRLPSLRYADSFSCQLTKRFEKPISLRGEAPLLWWLWDALLEWSTPSISSRGCTLDFTPAHRTDIVLPCTISIKLYSTGDGVDSIELTAAYGGDFMERRIFDAPIARFRFPETGFDRTTAALVIDQPPYNGNGCFKDMFDYLMPRSGNIWRSAMNVFPAEEKRLVQALAETCKAKDDYMYMSDDNDSQCKKLIQRFPPLARKFVDDGGLVGKERGPYSRSTNGPPGPKD